MGGSRVGGSASPDRLIKAWANFNGDTMAIRDSHNISSISDNGIGQYTVNFTNAMSNSNYAVAFDSNGDLDTHTAGAGRTFMMVRARTTTSVKVEIIADGGGTLDCSFLSIIIVGGN